MIIEEWKDTENEKEKILDITKKVYINSELASSKYYDWQYRNCPYGPAKILLAKEGNKIIGIEPIVPMELIINENNVLSSLSCNSIIDPEFQNHGIFSKMVSNIMNILHKEKISSVYGIPNKKSHSIFVKNGFEDITELPLLVRPLKISNYFSSPLKEIIKPFERLWKIKTSISDIQLVGNNTELEFDKIIINLSKRVPILQRRDKKFLEWRYKNHPTRKYETYILKEKNEIKGYIIIRITKFKKKKVGAILDFVVDSNIEDHDGPRNLVKKALQIFWENDVSISIAIGNNSLENKILHEVGFKTSPKFMKPEPLYFIIADKNLENVKKINNFKKWYFTLGDYDVF